MLPTITNYGQYSNDNYGKHLNWIQPDKKKRESYQAFEIMLKEALKRHIQ